MTPEEHQLITDLFERMRQFGAPDKDSEADSLIRQSVQRIPDAAYMLVQSVLVQEHALQQSDQRVRELEEKLAELEARSARATPSSGSFLGGLFGGVSRPAAAGGGGSVPSAGSRFGTGEPAARGPIGAPSASSPAPQQQGPAGGGGFMRSAISTAAGVAGGMLLANSITSLLGGSSAHATIPAGASGGQEPPRHDHREQASDQARDDAPHLQEADLEPDAGDWGADDFDI